jgi:SAM-dependent methyltransferase
VTASTLATHYPPPERPWTHEYLELHRRFVMNMLDDPILVERFARGDTLPLGYGVGLDERVVEFPWLFAKGLHGRVLDAGSVLNHEHILDRVLPQVDELHIVTLEPEALAFTQQRVSYLFADLRDLPYRDRYFDEVVCLSTLEHVGMDNSLYGVAEPRADDPDREMRHATAELIRVTAPDGRILVTVPYGRREDHGWFRQFDCRGVEALLETLGGTPSIVVFSYEREGWQVSDLDSAADKRYRDFLADPNPVADRAAAARAVVCIRVQLESPRS